MPHDLPGWLARFRGAPIPILGATAELLQALASRQEELDAHMLADALGADPLLTVRLLAHVAATCRRTTDVETVTGALVLLGIPPFFTAFAGVPTVEDMLHHEPNAQAGLNAVVERARRSATFALGIAVQRMDHDAAVIQEAALLHDFAEMLLWCHAPRQALELQRRLRADHTLHTADVQRDVLGIELPDLQQALMSAWHLPQLLIQLDDDRHAETAAVKNVLLATRLARHSAAVGWDHPVVARDVTDIAALLRLAPEVTFGVLKNLDT